MKKDATPNAQHSKIFRGFTLIELLITVTIIAVLVTIAFITYGRAQGQARDARRREDIQEIAKALELYYGEKGRYPNVGGWSTQTGTAWSTTSGSFADMLRPYLANLPIDPKNNDAGSFCAPSHFYTYYPLTDGKGYSIYTSLELVPSSPPTNDPSTYPDCCQVTGRSCMYDANQGGVGIVQVQ